MKVDLEAFRKYEEDRLVTCRPHANGELLIWNYTPRTQFERIWDDVTTQARGLITDLEGNIKARPFRKFFNYGEHEGEEPSLVGAKITEKYDGSLGILYHDGDDYHLATRGSFLSEQAIKGSEMLHAYIAEHGSHWIDPDVTYLFEIIYPSNRIVVDYEGEESLVLLAAFETETGKEIDVEHIDFAEKAQEWVDFADMKALYDLEKDNAEGLVVRFADGLRLKVKWDEYVRLHRILTGCSKKTIWEILAGKSENKLSDFIDSVPDEFYQWIEETKASLYEEFNSCLQAGFNTFRKVQEAELETKKDKALFLQKLIQEGKADRNSVAIAYALIDDKPVSRIMGTIWKSLKPEYETPFKKDIDA